MSGFVYAIESGDAVKIGFARDPLSRLAMLNVGSPGALRLLGFAHGSRDEEAELHKLAKGERIRGEWYRKGPVVLAFLQMLPPYSRLAPRVVASIDIAPNALLKAIRVKGSQASLAKSIGVTQQTISNWLTKSKVGVAPEYVLPIERETGVSRHELRPDIYPAEPIGCARPNEAA